MGRVAYYYDSSKCIGCRGCQVSCKTWNQEKAERTEFTGSHTNPPKLSPDTRMIMRFYEDFYPDTVPHMFMLKWQCFHCGDPGCVKACPSGCLQQDEKGIVFMDKDKCIACGYCRSGCPFGIPSIGKKVNKCDMCHSRINKGAESGSINEGRFSASFKTNIPACVKSCQSDALLYGDRDEMIEIGKKRVEWLKGRGYEKAQLYGLDGVDGLGVLSVITEDPEKFGLPRVPTLPLDFSLWRDIVSPFGAIALAGAAGMAAVMHWAAKKQDQDGHNDSHHDNDETQK
jgi:formate dehydrogenase iron-sulfur subunit